MKKTIKVGQYDISWISSEFQEVFGDVKVSPKRVKFQARTLEKKMTDSQIISEWKPTEATLDEVVYALDKKDGLLMNSYTNIFYVRDSKNTLWAVGAHWYPFCGGWIVLVLSVARAIEWRAGTQVLSKVFGTSDFGKLETLGLEK